MELGGKDPAYVLPDTNLDFAVGNIIDGAFFNSGQCCCSIERCYVDKSIYDDFIEKAVALTKVTNTMVYIYILTCNLYTFAFLQTYVLGDPNDQETTLGPMANIKFADNVRNQIDDAIKKGATPLIDTKKLFPHDKVID